MVAPTHPELLQGGLPTPTSTMLAGATSPCCLVVLSTPHGWTTSHTPSLKPFTFNEGALHSSEGGNAYPFCAQGLYLPPWKQTRHKYRPNRTFGVISLALPINLLDGLRWGCGIVLVLSFGRFLPFFLVFLS